MVVYVIHKLFSVSIVEKIDSEVRSAFTNIQTEIETLTLRLEMSDDHLGNNFNTAQLQFSTYN